MSQLHRIIEGVPARYRYIWVAGYIQSLVRNLRNEGSDAQRVEGVREVLEALADVQAGAPWPDALDAVKASGELAGMYPNVDPVLLGLPTGEPTRKDSDDDF